MLLVGVFPTDGNSTMHAIGAVLYLLGGGLGLIALAYAVRPRSEALGTTLALLGLIGTAATVFFLTGVTRYLGEGGTERAAAYVLPIGLAVAGVVLWRLTAGEPAGQRRGLTRREERERARAEKAERDRQRDEALEAAARRQPGRAAGAADDESDGTTTTLGRPRPAQRTDQPAGPRPEAQDLLHRPPPTHRARAAPPAGSPCAAASAGARPGTAGTASACGSPASPAPG